MSCNLKYGIVIGNHNKPIAQNILFNYVVSRNIATKDIYSNAVKSHLFSIKIESNIDIFLQKIFANCANKY